MRLDEEEEEGEGEREEDKADEDDADEGELDATDRSFDVDSWTAKGTSFPVTISRKPMSSRGTSLVALCRATIQRLHSCMLLLRST